MPREATTRDAVNLAKAVLLFHTATTWGKDEQQEFRRLTGGKWRQGTIQDITDVCREAIGRYDPPPPG